MTLLGSKSRVHDLSSCCWLRSLHFFRFPDFWSSTRHLDHSIIPVTFHVTSSSRFQHDDAAFKLERQVKYRTVPSILDLQQIPSVWLVASPSCPCHFCPSSDRILDPVVVASGTQVRIRHHHDHNHDHDHDYDHVRDQSHSPPSRSNDLLQAPVPAQPLSWVHNRQFRHSPLE